jgi:putative hydroxymethylpyrimidine transport system permease protein
MTIETPLENREPAETKRARGRGLVAQYAPPLMLVLAVVAIWELAIAAFDVQAYLFPAPSAIASALWSDREILSEHAAFTLKEIVLGFLIACGAGVAVAVVIHLSPLLRRVVYPLLVASQTIPIIVLAPIFVIVLGFGLLPKLAIVGFTCFFAVAVSTADGLRSIDPAYSRMMRTLYASRWAIFSRVEFPGALPRLFTGARISATYAALAAVFAEWSGSSSGLGYLIQQSAPLLDTARVFSAIAVLSGMAVVLVGAVTAVERLVVPWARD